MDSKLSRLCAGLLEAAWLAAVIATPLFFNIHSERVFEPDKLTLLRSIALFMALTWGVKFIDQRGWQAWRRLRWRDKDSVWRIPFVLPVLALVLVYFISTLFSITPRVSWAGSYQRLQGTYSTLSYVVIFAIMAATIRSRVQIGRVVTAVIITTIPVSFYGLLQHFGLDPLPWGGDVEARVAGHMGNAIFIAAYLIMAVPLTLGRIIDAFYNILRDEQLSVADVLRSAIYIFALAIQLLAIYWSGSRGPLIGLATGLFSFTLVLLVSLRNAASEQGAFGRRDLWRGLLLGGIPLLALLLVPLVQGVFSPLVAFSVFAAAAVLSVAVIFLSAALRRGWRWLWLSWLVLTALLAGWLLLFNVPAERLETSSKVPAVGPLLQTQLAWKELPAIGSYGRMLDPSQTTGRQKSNRVRVLIWEGVVDLISPHEPLSFPDGGTDKLNFWRPLIGYGPESMYVAYNRFYPPELATVEARNASPDRSHNETFDALVVTGLAGFVAWQALYLSVFYYGFRFLGVVASRRNRNFLFGAWIGGALVGAILSLWVFDPIYLGVAIPTGTIVGLILYLFYYALMGGNSRPQEDQRTGPLPVLTDRLLMNALLAAVLAHYVEVHFGIAVSVTRLHFFVYIALMLLIAHKLPALSRRGTKTTLHNRQKSPGRTPTSAPQGGVRGTMLLWMFLLTLLVGILGFEFTNYVLAPDQVIETGADLTAGDIFTQTLFLNPRQAFRDSPFVYLMIVLSWSLGVLLVVSEMARQGELNLKPDTAPLLAAGRRKVVGGILLGLGLAGIALRLFLPEPPGAAVSLGRSFALLGAILCLWVATNLLRDRPDARLAAAALAAGGLALVLPVLVAGAWLAGLLLLLAFGTVFYLLWHETLRPLLTWPLVLAVGSLAIGLLYTFGHAVLLREALLYLVFYQGIDPVSPLYTLFFRSELAAQSVGELRVLEARQSIRFLTFFYLFLFSMVFLGGLSLAWSSMKRLRARGSTAAYVGLAVALVLGIWLIRETNVRVVQADMVFKRARPFDEQALRQADPLAWDVAIDIYQEALDLAPWEDFYYLFLGRAYLERSAAAPADQGTAALLQAAESRLLDARAINPLNTDHTANLARLYTRWAATDPGADAAPSRLQKAEAYYEQALQLSPQNSVIRNEYARLVLELRGDCEQAIAIYQQSVAIDPFFEETYLGLTDTLLTCAAGQEDEVSQQALYEAAAVALEDGLAVEPGNARAWLQLGQIYQLLARYEEALATFDQARERDTLGEIPAWNFDFREAAAYREMGDIAMARALAEQARLTAPDEIAAQIESFLEELSGR